MPAGIISSGWPACSTWRAEREAQEATERSRRLSPADAERTGTSLVDLVITDEETGLGGRYLLQLAKRNRSPLPWTRLDVGSPVVLSPDTARTQPGTGAWSTSVRKSLRVALGSMSDDLAEHETWRLDLSSDEVAVQRQRAALQRARLARGDRLAELRDVLLGRRPPEFGREREEPALDPGLNEAQRQAVQFALAGARRGPDPRAAGHRQDDRRGGADPPGGPARREGPGLRPEQPGRGQHLRAAAGRRRAGGAAGASGPRAGRSSRPHARSAGRGASGRPTGPQAGQGGPGPVPPGRPLHPGQAAARGAAGDPPGGQDPAGRRPAAGGPGRRAYPRHRRCPVCDHHRPGQRAAGHAAVRPGRDRRGVPEHRAGLLDPAAVVRSGGAGRRPLPVAAHGRQPGGGGRGLGRQPVRAADGPPRPVHRPPADRPVPHAPGDHGLLVAGVLRGELAGRRLGARHVLADLPGVAATAPPSRRSSSSTRPARASTRRSSPTARAA